MVPSCPLSMIFNLHPSSQELKGLHESHFAHANMSSLTALQTWASWNMTTPLPPLAHCNNMSCAELCSTGSTSSDEVNGSTPACGNSYPKSAAALWDPHATSDLATCGLWWTVAMATHWNISTGNHPRPTSISLRTIPIPVGMRLLQRSPKWVLICLQRAFRRQIFQRLIASPMFFHIESPVMR